ncbi:protein arginine N-methyltransferase [Prochlorococcus marinus]|uniref:protein arginine N-methyltransferase n=1 Tax=Prochlorococcus marinus TaxID=1219 RepID=UPI0022B3F385|nr:tetratricopeptide repeat protein [Prochlorococcus marinus]
MKESNQNKTRKMNFSEVTIFSVPFDLGKVNENLTINTNSPSKSSKKQLIDKAFSLHSEGNTLEAAKYYQFLINQECNDHRVFSNYGAILQGLGKLKDAELSTRKAIEINPKFADGHFNLGIILKNLGKLKDAELSQRKAIEINPAFANAYSNLGNILSDLGRLKEAELSLRKAIEINPTLVEAFWNLYAISNNIKEAEERINQCLRIDKNFLKAKLTLSALKLHQGDKSLFNKLIETSLKDHPYMSSIKWVSSLPYLPELFFHRWALFDSMIKKSKKNRPFYEFGVWRGASFKYLIDTFKNGYGFDTFEGLPEDWYGQKKGSYSAEGVIPKIDGGTFIEGKFEDTLPNFFAKPKPRASIINFDADLYSSTLCALNYSKNIIDEDTILIFDEFIINQNWEQDEYKALNEFCSNHNFTYEVLAISYMTNQVAVKIINL